MVIVIPVRRTVCNIQNLHKIKIPVMLTHPEFMTTNTSAADDIPTDIATGPDQTPVQPIKISNPTESRVSCFNIAINAKNSIYIARYSRLDCRKRKELKMKKWDN